MMGFRQWWSGALRRAHQGSTDSPVARTTSPGVSRNVDEQCSSRCHDVDRPQAERCRTLKATPRGLPRSAPPGFVTLAGCPHLLGQRRAGHPGPQLGFFAFAFQLPTCLSRYDRCSDTAVNCCGDAPEDRSVLAFRRPSSDQDPRAQLSATVRTSRPATIGPPKDLSPDLSPARTGNHLRSKPLERLNPLLVRGAPDQCQDMPGTAAPTLHDNLLGDLSGRTGTTPMTQSRSRAVERAAAAISRLADGLYERPQGAR